MYKRQIRAQGRQQDGKRALADPLERDANSGPSAGHRHPGCLLYTSDAADERSSVDLGGRRIIKKQNTRENPMSSIDIR